MENNLILLYNSINDSMNHLFRFLKNYFKYTEHPALTLYSRIGLEKYFS